MAKLGGTAGIPSRPFVGREFYLEDQSEESREQESIRLRKN